MQHQVIFQPSGRRGLIDKGKTLLEASHELGVEIESVCGGARVCGKCIIKVEEGYFEKFNIDSKASNLSPISEEEKDFLTQAQLDDNYRFACIAEVHGDVLVFVPEESRGAQQVVLETGAERQFALNPAVKKYALKMEASSLEDHRGDFHRIQDAMAEKYGLQIQSIDFRVLQKLPNAVRDGDWEVTVTVWNDKEIVRVEPGVSEKIYGMAVDVGTTTVAAYLCDLTNMETVAVDSIMNPQVRFGEDVLSRVTYSMMNEDGLDKMMDAMVDGLNTLAQRMAEKVGITTDDIMDITLVFNTVMHHIALGIDPKFVGRSPFTAAVKESLDTKARDLGLKINNAAYVHTLPVEAGFVGPDNVAALIAEEPYKQNEEVVLLIDIGTNGEIAYGNRDKMFCTSCATGPALEGAQIKFGMRAAPGAIEVVKIDPETKEPSYKVIGEELYYPELQKTGARGICGSGIIDVIAEMFKAGIIQRTGRINMKLDTPRIRKGEDGKPEYVLAWAAETSIGRDITVTQADIRAVQLAKSALYVGAKYLMERLENQEVDRIVLAGAFGSYINRESAMVIGLIPDCDLEKVVAVGNAAGDGAKLALLDVNKRVEANEVARKVEFVETATEPDFQSRFAEAMWFPHAKDKFPHVQHILDKIKE